VNGAEIVREILSSGFPTPIGDAPIPSEGLGVLALIFGHIGHVVDGVESGWVVLSMGILVTFEGPPVPFECHGAHALTCGHHGDEWFSVSSVCKHLNSLRGVEYGKPLGGGIFDSTPTVGSALFKISLYSFNWPTNRSNLSLSTNVHRTLFRVGSALCRLSVLLFSRPTSLSSSGLIWYKYNR